MTKPSSAVVFVKKRNERCLNGLEFDYFLPTPLPLTLLADQLQNTYEHGLFRFDEHYGSLPVIRFVIQFVAEVRLGEREKQVTLIHRMSADTSRRRATELWLEQVLIDIFSGDESE